MTTTAAAAFSETGRTSEKVISETAHVAYLAPLTWRLRAPEPSTAGLAASTEAWQPTAWIPDQGEPDPPRPIWSKQTMPRVSNNVLLF